MPRLFPVLFFNDECFDNITFLNVQKILNTDSTFVGFLHFRNIFLEVFKRGNFALMDAFIIS